MSIRVKVTGDLFHGRIPDGCVYVGRQAPGLYKSRYANPYPVKVHGLEESLRLYRLHAATFNIQTLRRDLAGKTWPAGAHSTSHATPTSCWSWPTAERGGSEGRTEPPLR
jgi:hypothetical protein